MSQDPAIPPAIPPAAHPPASDADTLAAARAVQQLLHGMAPPGAPAGELPTLSDIPVLPPLPPEAAAPAEAASAVPVRHFRALCTCCGNAWETEVDLNRHPEQALLCPRCEATIRHQTDGFDDIRRPRRPAPAGDGPPAGDTGIAPQAGPPLPDAPSLPTQGVPLDSLPALPRSAHAALPDALADPPPPGMDPPALPAERSARPIPLALAAVGALLLLALGVGIGVEWGGGDHRRPSQAEVSPPPRAAGPAAPGARIANTAFNPPAANSPDTAPTAARAPGPTPTPTPTTSAATAALGMTSTSGTRAAPRAPARAPAPAPSPAPAAPRSPPPACTAAVAAMGLCNAN
jgi:hypothetical protein